MNEIHGRVQKQVQLPLRRVFEIAWGSIRVRLFRSLLVTSGIILALAFLAYILSSDNIKQSVIKNGSPELIQSLQRDGVLPAPESAEDDAAKDGEEEDDEEEKPKKTSLEDQRAQTWWLVGLALMVSFVGILNAMLLSVTERYAEIGTMKCLGALDFLIVELFLLESAMQGFVGTAIGVIIGLGLTLLESWATYGSEVWSLIPLGEQAAIAGICLLAGTVLTVCGALYPAWRAARMQPVDAMRSEV
jgi:putative ABC transport system permease protein